MYTLAPGESSFEFATEGGCHYNP
jgi:hypothetical protein